MVTSLRRISDMTFIVSIIETTGAKIGVTAEASSAQKAFKAALRSHNEMKDIIRKECPNLLEEPSPKKDDLLAENDLLSDPKKTRKTISDLIAEFNLNTDPTSPEAQNWKRLDELLRDEEGHFSKHIVGGKIQSLDKNCVFCSAYYDKLSKHYPTTSE